MPVQDQEKAISATYNTLERLAHSALNTHGAKCFAELPDDTKNSLLNEQSRLFALHGISRDHYLGDLEFIAID